MVSETSSSKTSHLLGISSFLLRLMRFMVALAVCLVAVALPYRLRLFWYQCIAQLVHLPFRAFGALARFIMNKTNSRNPFKE